MALPLERTLAHLMTELRYRLGFGAQVLSPKQSALFKSWITGAQTYLYKKYAPNSTKHLDESLSTSQGERFYEWPDYVNPDRLIGEGVSCFVSGRWIPLIQGIDIEHRSFESQRYPTRFEITDRLEIWPVPDKSYPIRIECYKRIREFTNDVKLWTANTQFNLCDKIIHSAGERVFPEDLIDIDHYITLITEAGISGATEPNWRSLKDGDAVTDGAATGLYLLNTAVIDSAIILEMAVSTGKAHYKHADADFSLNVMTDSLKSNKGQQHGKRRYIRGKKIASTAYDEPKRV